MMFTPHCPFYHLLAPQHQTLFSATVAELSWSTSLTFYPSSWLLFSAVGLNRKWCCKRRQLWHICLCGHASCWSLREPIKFDVEATRPVEAGWSPCEASDKSCLKLVPWLCIPVKSTPYNSPSVLCVGAFHCWIIIKIFFAFLKVTSTPWLGMPKCIDIHLFHAGLDLFCFIYLEIIWKGFVDFSKTHSKHSFIILCECIFEAWSPYWRRHAQQELSSAETARLKSSKHLLWSSGFIVRCVLQS